MSALDFLSTDMQLGNQAAAYKPATFGEVVQSAMYAFGQRTGYEAAPILETAQDYSERESLLNERFAPDELTKLIGTDQELKDEALRRDIEKGIPLDRNYLPDITAIKSERLNSAIIQGREQDPARWQGIKTNDELREEKRNRARAAMESYQDVVSRASSTSALAGSLVGGLGAAFTDPINVATLPFGATAGMGILKAIKTEALLNAAVEAAEIPLVASWQKELGYKYGVGDAALDVAFAGAGGAAFTGIVRGVKPAANLLSQGFDAAGKYVGSRSQPILQKIADSETLPSSVREAASYMSRVSHIDENNPIVRDVAEGVEKPTQVQDIALHRQTLQDTQDAFRNYDQPVFDERLESDFSIRSDADLYLQLQQIRAELNKLEKPKTLLQFLKENGGIREQGGELAYMDLKNKDYPGLVKKNGMFLDAAGEKAWEAGYFAERPTVNDLVEAIREDFTSRNVFSENARDLVSKREELSDFINQSEQYFDQKGIDLSKKEIIKQLKLKAKLEKIQSEKKITEERLRPVSNESVSKIEDDIIFRPNDALASMQRDVETMESLNSGDTFRAEFERLLKENPDLEIETEAGRITLREIKEQIEADENILSAIKTCALGRR